MHDQNQMVICAKNPVEMLSFIIKNVSSSTTHKKNSVFTSLRLSVFPSFRLSVFTSLRLSVYPSLRLSVCTRIYEPCNPSPNDFPTLCEQFSALFPLKGRGARRFSLLRFDFWIRQYSYNSHIFRVMIYTS